MATATPTRPRTLNGIDTQKLFDLVDRVASNPAEGAVSFGVTTRWAGGAVSDTAVDSYRIGGRTVNKRFNIRIDEPLELCGSNTQPNPQEYLMAAFNACMLVGYVAGATVHGITLEKLEIQTQGDLDLRGFLGIDPDVKPGYDTIHYTVRIKGDGTPEQFQKIHEAVIATSPNRFNVANPIRLTSDLFVE